MEEAVADSNLTKDGTDTTTELLALAKAGHPTAIEMLYRRCLPSLRVWARGRLPRYARDRYETQDLVQDTLMHTLTRLDSFELGRPGGLKAYLRRGIINRICDEIRRVTRRPESFELTECADVAPSALELMIGREVVKRYEAALARLSAGDRAAITARLEDHQSYDDIARLLGKPNGNAARMAISRAIDRLITEMNSDGTKSSRLSRRHTSQTRSSSKGRPPRS
jgi:RNA polymerase sigma-70 factor, ECF subfamily